MKYRDWLYEWLGQYVKPSSKDKTYRHYEEIVRLHIVPRLGEYEVGDITPMAAQRFVTELLQSGNRRTGKGLAPNTVNPMIAVIQGSLQMAYQLGLTEKYEMDRLKRPKSKEKKVECFTIAEQKKIEQAVLSDKRIKMRGIVLCLYTGLRIGELLALEWGDISFADKTLTVSRACHDGKGESGKSIRMTDTPKTSSSCRMIPLTKPIISLLKDMRRNSCSPYVVAQGETAPSVRSYQRSFELLLKKEKIPHRGFHSLRHTFATRALECGMDVKTLSEILGHKSPTVTLNRYVHSLTKHKKEMMERVGRLL